MGGQQHGHVVGNLVDQGDTVREVIVPPDVLALTALMAGQRDRSRARPSSDPGVVDLRRARDVQSGRLCQSPPGSPTVSVCPRAPLERAGSALLPPRNEPKVGRPRSPRRRRRAGRRHPTPRPTAEHAGAPPPSAGRGHRSRPAIPHASLTDSKGQVPCERPEAGAVRPAHLQLLSRRRHRLVLRFGRYATASARRSIRVGRRRRRAFRSRPHPRENCAALQ
jgi:hypothetical protein